MYVYNAKVDNSYIMTKSNQIYRIHDILLSNRHLLSIVAKDTIEMATT